jgi:hypothetical protein
MCHLIFFSGKAWFANKSMKPIQGCHLIKPEGACRMGHRDLGARLWRLPPRSRNSARAV